MIGDSQIPVSKIFTIQSVQEFNDICFEIFHFQYNNNEVYRSFSDYLDKGPDKVNSLYDIPFLPVSFFKSHKIISGNTIPEAYFSSSGTTGSIESRHFIKDFELYERSFRKGFRTFYGDITEYTILALLPSYLERKGSSLIYMIDRLMNLSAHPSNGYYLYNHQDLYLKLKEQKEAGRKTILFGVSFALLDFIEHYNFSWSELIVMETGGMKGRRKELVREELHKRIKEGLGLNSVHSEYGMTELLSQAYSSGDGIYFTPPWMKIMIRDTNDPLSYVEASKTGGINIIDLANLYSCSFISTSDLGRISDTGAFEVLGRFDISDIRGCNLMVE